MKRPWHYDLTMTNATSWQWWTALSQCDYEDGLIYLDAGNNGIANQQSKENLDLMHDGNYHDSKLMWGMGNYSLFVRPGYKRIDATYNENHDEKEKATDLMVSAYKSPNEKKIVIVAVNYSNETKKIDWNVSNIKELNEKNTQVYVTSKDDNLSLIKSSNAYTKLKPRSITSIVINI